MDTNYCESFLSYLLCSNKLFLFAFPIDVIGFVMTLDKTQCLLVYG